MVSLVSLRYDDGARGRCVRSESGVRAAVNDLTGCRLAENLKLYQILQSQPEFQSGGATEPTEATEIDKQ